MKKTITQLLEYGRIQLNQDIFVEREEELSRIIMDIMNIHRYEISLAKNTEVTNKQYIRFKEIIQQRKTGKPLAYILGYSYFYQDKFPVSEQTLIPRYDTEILVEAVRKHYSKEKSFRILDIGTGTGIIALSLHRLFSHAIITGIDIFDAPFKRSKKYLGISSQNVQVEQKDFLDESLWQELGKWDCIVSNPPYLDDNDMILLDSHVKIFEPHTALYAEADGMIFYKAIAKFAKKNLAKDGAIFLEIDHKHEKVSKLFPENEFVNRELVDDLSGLPRVLILKN